MATGDDDDVEEVALGDVRPGARAPAPPVPGSLYPPMTPLRITGTANATETFATPGLDQRVRSSASPRPGEAAVRRRRAADYAQPQREATPEPTHHLRGSAGGGASGSRAPSPPPESPVDGLTMRESRLVERKMTLNKLSEDSTQYWGWRVHVIGELIQHVPYETEAGRLYVA